MEHNREKKIEWMKENIKKYKEKDELLMKFVIEFHSTMNTAKEVWSIVKYGN